MELRQIGSGLQNNARVTDTAQPATTQSPAIIKSEATRLETAKAVQQIASVPTMAQVAEAVAKINKSVQASSQNLEFAIDSDSDRIIVKVVDQQTQQVLRQFPSEEALEIAKSLDSAQGLLIRQKV